MADYYFPEVNTNGQFVDPKVVADIREKSLTRTGPGRPDQVATTSGAITGSEAVGTTYYSTDGAGVGAWAWRKRADNTWAVIDGDTGWRNITSLCGSWASAYANGFTVRARVTTNLVTVAVSGMTATTSGTVSAGTVLFVINDDTNFVNYSSSSPTWNQAMLTGYIGRAGNINTPAIMLNKYFFITGSFYADHSSYGNLTSPRMGVWPTSLPGTAA